MLTLSIWRAFLIRLSQHQAYIGVPTRGFGMRHTIFTKTRHPFFGIRTNWRLFWDFAGTPTYSCYYAEA
jgi:hypothetical protein